MAAYADQTGQASGTDWNKVENLVAQEMRLNLSKVAQAELQANIEAPEIEMSAAVLAEELPQSPDRISRHY